MTLGDSVAVVLVEPRFPGNLGSTARVMANLGFSRLLLVNPCPVDVPEARRMALNALPIIQQARVHASLEEALSGFQYAVATTCRGGNLRKEPYDPRRLGAWVINLVPENQVALVFGPEDRGLTNEELCLCQAVAAIPSDPVFPSLNLSHAVLVILWELSMAGAPPAPSARALAEAAKVEGMYRHLEDVLLRIGFLRPENPRRIIRELKRILNRAGLEERDVKIIRGILRQFDWYLRHR